jgi:hypothetical protein
MKQNKVLQVITILISTLIQIGLFLLILTNVHTAEVDSFNTSILLQILPSYGLVILSILILGGIIYGGYYVKKHKQSWLTYIQENIIKPLHKSLAIGCGLQAINFCILIITLLVNLHSEELRQQLILLLNIVGITAVVTGFSGVVLEICFIDKENTCFLDKSKECLE